MSLLGRFNDWISGQPAGTSDSIAASDAATTAANDAITLQQLNRGIITQAQYDQEIANGANQASNSVLDQTGQLVDAATTGAVDAAGNPVQVLDTGLTWEGQTAGNAISSVTSAATGAAGNVLGKFLAAIPIWVWLAAAAGLFLYLGGGSFLERKARRRLSQ
jgi:hypothetical protein